MHHNVHMHWFFCDKLILIFTR